MTRFLNLTLQIYSCINLVIKALASARGSEQKAQSRKNRTILPVPIYVFDDSEQKVEYKVRIKTMFPLTKLYEIFIVASFMIY